MGNLQKCKGIVRAEHGKTKRICYNKTAKGKGAAQCDYEKQNGR